ncbi:MAG: FAD-dependent oxidoreductase [Humidesulfovibrio sp.]|uniref:NAD(P)/FAD-dependent oxidoreductase n=1 Tax=Humidesulfovibrio sp. TaxID=2910988 RepID=UPI0027F5886E|nr:FAD-dependent oxidoreductase [Humidesulfovibrio sp.]MDQ7835858.1 FAD-dependent oxidoreductase [Humidesulfovibrio sp.]
MTQHSMYDVVILGCGPAGIQAAIHASRKKAGVLLLGRMNKSNLFWAHVENFLGMFKTSGEDMLKTGLAQAESFGAELMEEDALSISHEKRCFEIETESGRKLCARSLILATGTTRNKLGVPGEKELLGRGVSYCVDCDGGFFRGEVVAVVGGQSAAVSGALTLLHLAESVHLICESLDVSPVLQDKLRESGVSLHEGVTVKAITGDSKVEGLTLSDGTSLPVAGVFIEQGAKGVLELASTLGLTLDESMKYIQTDKAQATSVPGVFAAGDICGPPLQMAKAVGEGCVAGTMAATYAKNLKLAQEGGAEE